MKKRMFLSVLALSLIFTLLPVSAFAAELPALALQSELDWRDADAFGRYDYYVANPKTGYAQGYYLMDNGDSTVSAFVCPYNSSEFSLERYNADGSLAHSKTVPLELPIFGAFLAGEDCFYVALGQENLNRDDMQEVWRIVKYDRDGNRIGSVSANGGDTYTAVPFDCTVSRMTLSEDEKTLILYAARERYDGHQSNITFFLDTATMTWQSIWGESFPDNHVGHSFGQFVRFDGDEIVTVDHGDAYPRSFVLQVDTFEIDLLELYGTTGDNVTNAIGSGFEVSESGYLFLGCSDPQTGNGGTWNLFLSFLPKATGEAPDSMTFGNITVYNAIPHGGFSRGFKIGGVWYYVVGSWDIEECEAAVYAYLDAITPTPTTIWLTDSDTDINCARLVKLDDAAFAAMWEQNGDLHWQMLDGYGQRMGREHILTGVPMPPTDPIVTDRTIRWIQTVEDTPHLFTLDVDTGSLIAPDTSASAPSTPLAYASTQMIELDGKSVELQAYALVDAQGSSTNYVKLRDIAFLLNGTAAQFDVEWDGTIRLVTGQNYSSNGTEMKTPFSGNRPYAPGSSPLKLNDTAVSHLDAFVLLDDNENGYTYFKLRDLGRLLGFNVGWSAQRGIFLETDKPYTDAD